MFRIYSPQKTEEIIRRYGPCIARASERYGIPAALIKAVMYKEMTEIDAFDPAADLAVLLRLPGKKDSSTGYMQIFGRVGLMAVNAAVEKGLTDYGQLGLRTDHVLDPTDPADVRLVWMKLYKDPEANIEIGALNLLSCADEMTGKSSFEGCPEEELKLILTRYNANVRHVTAYGEEAYRHYQRYLSEERG